VVRDVDARVEEARGSPGEAAAEEITGEGGDLDHALPDDLAGRGRTDQQNGKSGETCSAELHVTSDLWKGERQDARRGGLSACGLLSGLDSVSACAP
jgi:hypothetical protein